MRIPEAPFERPARVLLSILFLSSALSLTSCQESGAFGMSAEKLAHLLAGKDIAPVLALAEPALDDTGRFGASAYYYLGRWLDSRGPVTAAAAPPSEAAAKAMRLYRRAFDDGSGREASGSGLMRREAGLALIGGLAAAGLWDELLSFSAQFATSVGGDWRAERPRLEALDALGHDAAVLGLVARLKSTYPAEAEEEADALAYFAAAADMRIGGKAWTKGFRRLLLESPGSEWTEKAYALSKSDQRVAGLFSQDELHALAMRDAIRRKEYGIAYKEALLGPAASMGRDASKAMIADAGRAFLFSGALKEGEGRFAAQGWTARYYKARFAKALERWKEAEELFRKAVGDAPTRADADSASWYAADCAYRGALAAAAGKAPPRAKAAAEAAARVAALDGLVAISGSWRDPAIFSDLAGNLFRDALRGRDWRLVQDMAERLAPKLSSELSARIAYTAALASELGLSGGSAGSAEALFVAIAENGDAPLHYRALAAWRAGIEPALASLKEAGAIAVPEGGDAKGEIEAFIDGLASFGLGDIAVAEAKSRRASLSDEALRRLATRLSSLARPDCALRLELELMSRPGYEARRSDYELLYPRPYLEEIRSLRHEPRVAEDLALGLIRSESVFRVEAVSRAGAIGLSQLMPATAAERARAIGLKVYDLNLPRDNLAIGLAHFAFLLERSGDRPLRAMMAYNAGWGRLKSWLAESGELPDDLMIEALGIEETRQYCRNILQATVMYGLMYYDRSVVETVGNLIEGRKEKAPASIPQ
jgi:soluble lytic murein transglycosylase-like protein